MYHTITVNMMVKDVKETIEFYEEKLKFEKVLTVPEDGDFLHFAILKKDHISIMLQEQKNLLAEYPTLQSETIIPTFTLFITVENILETYEALKDQVEVVAPLHQTFYGREEFAIRDCNGNILTIAC